MPMQLRENLGNRLILKVASEATSKIALGPTRSGAFARQGPLGGQAQWGTRLVFAQAPFLSDDDIALAVEAIAADSKENLGAA
jgi:S-DNA-T family DNA segregation ATPase FtsK/SpoIIIE